MVSLFSICFPPDFPPFSQKQKNTAENQNVLVTSLTTVRGRQKRRIRRSAIARFMSTKLRALRWKICIISKSNFGQLSQKNRKCCSDAPYLLSHPSLFLKSGRSLRSILSSAPFSGSTPLFGCLFVGKNVRKNGKTLDYVSNIFVCVKSFQKV